MEQSLQVLEWQAQAYAEGEAKGKAEGEAKGKAEGEAKGKAEGEAKGKAETLLRVLRGRFPGQVPPDLAAKILATKDLGQLDQWVDAAAQVASFEDFRRLIPT